MKRALKTGKQIGSYAPVRQVRKGYAGWGKGYPTGEAKPVYNPMDHPRHQQHRHQQHRHRQTDPHLGNDLRASPESAGYVAPTARSADCSGAIPTAERRSETAATAMATRAIGRRTDGQDARGTGACHGRPGHARARAGRPWHAACSGQQRWPRAERCSALQSGGTPRYRGSMPAAPARRSPRGWWRDGSPSPGCGPAARQGRASPTPTSSSRPLAVPPAPPRIVLSAGSTPRVRQVSHSPNLRPGAGNDCQPGKRANTHPGWSQKLHRRDRPDQAAALAPHPGEQQNKPSLGAEGAEPA
jgi:hypothetical protein